MRRAECEATHAELRTQDETERFLQDEAFRAFREAVYARAKERRWNPAIVARALRALAYEAASIAVGDWHEAEP